MVKLDPSTTFSVCIVFSRLGTTRFGAISSDLNAILLEPPVDA